MTERFVRGAERYIDDISGRRCLWAAFVRSPHAHARIRDVRWAGSSTPPLALMTARELRASVHPLRIEGPGLSAYDWYPLAVEKALFVGDAVAVVVGRSRYEAEDMLEGVEVDYEPLPPVTTMESAAAAESLVHEEVRGNVFFQFTYNEGAAPEAFERAEVVVEEVFHHPRQTPLPMEGCGVIAEYDLARESYTIWMSTQMPTIMQCGLSVVLGVPEDCPLGVLPGGFPGAASFEAHRKVGQVDRGALLSGQ